GDLRAKPAGNCADFAREGRVAVHGRREHECACGHNPPGRSRRGRHAFEPAQDILDAARWRGSGSRSGRNEEDSRAVPPGADPRGKRGRPDSIGKVKAFSSNFGVLVRALAYILAYGPGVRQATEDAVLNANYIRKQLEGFYDLPYSLPSMHEVVFSDAIQKKNGVNTMD